MAKLEFHINLNLIMYNNNRDYKYLTVKMLYNIFKEEEVCVGLAFIYKTRGGDILYVECL